MKLLLTGIFTMALAAAIVVAAEIPWSTPTAVRYIDDGAVSAALAKGGVLLQDPGLVIAGERKAAPSAAASSATTNQFFLVREGEATLVMGGTLVGAAIEGGRSRRLKAGDMMVVPAKTPYWWKEVPAGGIAYLAIKRETPRSGNTWGLPDVVQYISSARLTAQMSDVGGSGEPLLVDPGVVSFAQRKFKDDEPEIHPNHSHIFVLMDGEATFLTGEHGAPIKNGKAVGATKLHQIRRGGIMIVPSTTPHQWVSITGNKFGPKDAIGYIAINMDDPK